MGIKLGKLAFLFPGQGAQFVGMGKEFYEEHSFFRDTVEEAQDLASLPLKKAMFDGPKELLMQADLCQIATFVMSVGILRCLKHLLPALEPHYCAGLSVGEYAALYGAKRARFADLLDLVLQRAQLMKAAAKKSASTLGAAVGIDLASLRALIKESGYKVYVANVNAPTQVVVGGAKGEMSRLASFMRGKGVKMIPLHVDAAFHTPFMEEPSQRLAPLISTLHLQESETALVSNVTGEVVEEWDRYRDLLSEQMVSPVLWSKSIETMEKGGVKLYVEIGCGEVLAGLNRRNAARGATMSIETLAQLDEMLEKLSPYAKERLIYG